MALHHRSELAIDVILTHFGELVKRVCMCLVKKGPVGLPEIVRSTEMNVAQLRNCLLVLVQHNCVQAFKVEQDGAVGQAAPKAFTSYIVLINNILHRLRFPKFLVIVREELGEEATAVVEGLLEHGRLTLEQVVQRAAARAGKSEAEVEKSLKQTFAALVRSHYIERCPAPEPVVTPKSSLEAPKKAQRGVQKSKLALAGLQQPDRYEDCVAAAAASLDTERFRMPSSLEGVGETVSDSADVSMLESAASGQKRKRDALAMDSKTMALVDEKEVLWRVNFEEFTRKLRHQATVAHVGSRIDPGAGTVLAAMLEATRSREVALKQQISAPLSMSAITQAVTMTSEGRSITIERIRGALQHMSSESVGFITRTGDGGSSYAINIDKIIESAQHREVEAIVLQRFGRESCRIYRLLIMKGQMEQKQIAGMAMVQLKNARELLYKLLKEQFVNVQEVAKTAEHSAQKAFYLWNVTWQTVKQLVLNDMCHAATNLRQRLAHELEQEHEALDAVKQIQVAKATGTDSNVTLSQRQLQQVKRVRQLASVLEASLLRLDKAIVLFNDF